MLSADMAIVKWRESMAFCSAFVVYYAYDAAWREHEEASRRIGRWRYLLSHHTALAWLLGMLFTDGAHTCCTMTGFLICLHLHTRMKSNMTIYRPLGRHFTYCMYYTVHRVSKNVPPLTFYSLDLRNPIRIIFGRSVTEKVRNQTMLCFPTSPL